MAETLAETVARLEHTRQAAVTSVTVDGITTQIDQTVAGKELRAAKRRQAIEDGTADPRPVCAQIKLT